MLPRLADCRSCGAVLSGAKLDLGPLPASNRFTVRAGRPETHPLIVRVCESCGLVQLERPAPPSFVVPRVPWIRYREPDAHLDDVVERLREIRPGTVLATGPFDAPLTDRLSRHGTTVAQLPLPLRSGAEATAYPYLETIQAGLESAALRRAAEQLGLADLVCCRYLLEHCHEPVAALIGLAQLVSAEGVLLVEVPDSAKFIARRDYSFIWEEHVSYFTERTLRAAASRAGLDVAALLRYEGVLEDALIAILRPMTRPAIVPYGPEAETAAFAAYAADFAPARAAWQARLAQVVEAGGRVALLGAGHQAVMFVNAFGLQDYLSIVADDDPDKQGYHAAGLAVPIVPSSSVAADPDVTLCLLAVGPGAEAKVRAKLAAVTDRGGAIDSIFVKPEPP